MILEGEFDFQAPRETVWGLLHDPQVLERAMPGARSMERVGEDLYSGRMVVGVGPVSAAEFAITVELHGKVEPERYEMKVDGQGPLGFTRGAATVELDEDGDRGTVMRYRAELQVGGRIAGVGQRLLDTVAGMMMKQGLNALDREITRRLEEEA
jgi:uncharacterized protein